MISLFQNLTHGIQGIVYALVAIFLISLQDILVKMLSQSGIPLHELLAIRYILALVMFGWLVVAISSYEGLKTEHIGKHILRGLLAFTSGASYYLALAVLPVAETVAIFFSAPLFVTLFSVLLLQEKVGIQRWGATGLGFIGVLVMVRPGGDVFHPMALFVLLAAACYALSMLLARKMGSTESAVNLSFYSMITNLGGALTMAGFVSLGLLRPLEQWTDFDFITNTWIMPDSWVLLVIFVVSIITVLTFHLITQAYRITAPSLLALFEYTSMFWAILWGITFFHQYPDFWTMVGIMLVVCAGVYTIAREAWTGTGSKKWFTGRALSRFR